MRDLFLFIPIVVVARDGWQSWSQWSDCPDLWCGEAIIRRTRSCRPNMFGIDNCPVLKETEEQSCADLPVCTHVWGEWGEWSECPVTCGRGHPLRRRECLNVETGSFDKGDACQGKCFII